MVDNNKQGKANTEIDLDALNKDLSQSNSGKDSDQESVIWKVNLDDNSVDLRYTWNDVFIQRKNKRYWKYNPILLILILLFVTIWYSAYKYDQFIVNYADWTETIDNRYFSTFEKIKQKIYPLLKMEYEATYAPIDLNNERWYDNLRSLLQSDKSYIYKKESLKTSTNNLFNAIISNANRLDETKKHVSTYWFFSDKLTNIISEDEPISAIQDSMAAIESIKFSSAISVFSKLDTFVETLSKEIWMDKSTIIKNMNQISDRGEKDINLYIKNCHLNPAEIDYNCNNIGDFNKYYELIQDSGFNVSFFKKLMQSIDVKLEQSEVPSFSIKFKSFDPQSKELSFDVEINTFKEDEIELAKNWILSPHSFILSNLMNNLKLSRSIVSELISVNSITINQRTLKFWSTEFVVNTSEKTFTVPIKKENQVEIDDFVY